MLTAIKRRYQMGARRPWPGLCCLIASALSACSGNGIGLDTSGQPLNGQGGGLVPLSADFDSIQANVFTPICSVCHSGAAAPEGLMLDAQHSYSLLVNVPSTEVASILRVDPGNPNNSYIIQKLEGHAAVGAQMPFGQPPLPAATINFIAQWITDGAPAGQAGAAAAAFTVAAVAPLDGAALGRAPPQIALAFTRALDATHLDANSVRLQRLMEPMAAADGSSESVSAATVPADLHIPTGNEHTLLLTPRQGLSNGDYQIVLSTDVADQLAALDGARLSNPARPGDDYVIARFSLRVQP